MESREISQAVIGRLPRYYRYLGDLKEQGVERISSQELSTLMHVTASQIRQDFNHFGGFGQQGYGYNTQYLYEEIGKILEAGPQKETLVFGKRIQMQPFLSETDLIRILSDVRLILDVRDQPDLYLQIAGISAGIPQINYRYTRYVDHKKDGYIIQNISYVHEALVYYLSQLNHWNEALMYCVEKAENYTSGALVTQWKERLDAGS